MIFHSFESLTIKQITIQFSDRKCTDKDVHVTNLQTSMTSRAVVLRIGDTATGLCQCLPNPQISNISGTVYLSSNINENVNTV